MSKASIDLDKDILKELDKLADLENSERRLLFREVINKGLKEVKMDLAVKKFGEKKVTTSEAADIADVPIGEMMDELAKRGIKPEINQENLKESLKNARKAIKN